MGHYSNLALTEKIRSAIEKSVNQLLIEYPNDEFFTFCICTYPFIDSLSLSVNSIQNFEEIRPNSTDQDSPTMEDFYYKWTPEEWGKFEAIYMDLDVWSDAINHMNQEIPNPFETLGKYARRIESPNFLQGAISEEPEALEDVKDDPSFNNMEYVLGCMCEAMIQLDQRGFFDFENRKNVLLFAGVIGEMDFDRVAAAEKINADKVERSRWDEFVRIHREEF